MWTATCPLANCLNLGASFTRTQLCGLDLAYGGLEVQHHWLSAISFSAACP